MANRGLLQQHHITELHQPADVANARFPAKQPQPATQSHCAPIPAPDIHALYVSSTLQAAHAQPAGIMHVN